MNLGFHDIAAAWWPYAFILLAGWLPTDIWRYLGVLSAGRIDEASPWLGLVRAVATGMVAAVIARMVLYPSGSLADVPDAVRIGALLSALGVVAAFAVHTPVGLNATRLASMFALPVVAAVPLQLLAYYAAVAKGTDVDKPRNLAKSVTVE